MTELPWQSFEDKIKRLRGVNMLEWFYCITLEPTNWLGSLEPRECSWKGQRNAVITKLIKNMLVMGLLACLSSSARLMTDNIVRELLSVGTIGFQNSRQQGQY